ncbi:hypothetical protein EHQ53_00685 [Leptospira langatensis]|uniref:Uncharacterized protein n=1 Tax=Leptospira langatensis TaxID=2484983 RepID=A0A5F1ZWZ3_9LEPT|nr:hypothetical protein [Leptospira langatensis]TGJ98280.1 hypothetical protein EHO57_16830 [Leptospira langatensis]TGL43194.1 hypothetical protein EHQ53_00685 [Leptospira langatensis]
MLPKVLILVFLICSYCRDVGIDTSDVTRANDAYRKVINSFMIKFAICTAQGNQYATTAGAPGIGACSGDAMDYNKGMFVWTKSLDSCLHLINLSLCPRSGENFDAWTGFILSACDFREAYFINDYKPLQGKILGIPGGLMELSTNCL